MLISMTFQNAQQPKEIYRNSVTKYEIGLFKGTRRQSETRCLLFGFSLKTIKKIK